MTEGQVFMEFMKTIKQKIIRLNYCLDGKKTHFMLITENWFFDETKHKGIKKFRAEREDLIRLKNLDGWQLMVSTA